jgi:hypothetical protein
LPTCALDSCPTQVSRAERALREASVQRGMATTVVYTKDESPELVRHEGMELFR